MPAQVILEFEGVTTKEYDAVNAALGIDPVTGSGDWPEGLQVHAAGLNERGHLGRDRNLGHARSPVPLHGGSPQRRPRARVVLPPRPA